MPSSHAVCTPPGRLYRLLERFAELQGAIRQGRHGRLGWEKSMVANFWGGQSIAGLIPYVYHKLHKGKNRELDRF